MKINIGEGIDLDVQLVMTGRGCVIGQSGSGKSFLMGVVAEELCRLNLPFLVVDTEGEYHNLKRSFKVIWVSNSNDADVNLDVDYGRLVEESITGNVPIIFDVSDTVDQSSYVYDMLSALYDFEDKRHMPYLVMIEEADKLAPQVTHSKNNMVEEISVRGRKRGIGLLIATQRPANISKNVLSQCSYGFIGKLTIENDIAAIDILFSNRQLRDSIVRLGQGEFVTFGIGLEHAVRVKGRSIEHYGSTPKVVSSAQSTDIDTIIGRLGWRNPMLSEKHNKGVLHEPQRGTNMPAKPEEIKVIKHAYSKGDAIEYANRMAVHRLAGMALINANETVESVSTFYYPLRHLRILVPKSNSHKFIERYAFIDSEARIARIDKGLKFINTGIKPGASLTGRQENLLKQLRTHGKSEIDKLEKLLGIKSISRDIGALVRIGSVKQSGKYYALNDMLKFSSKHDIEAISSGSADVGGAKRIKSGKAMAAAKIMFPGCSVYDLDVAYIEMYKINLRKKDKLRVFVIDSISFKDRTSDIAPF